jgi:CxxC motif-containing protein (DUF1111 family)
MLIDHPEGGLTVGSLERKIGDRLRIAHRPIFKRGRRTMTPAGRLLAIGLFGAGAAFLAGNLSAETGDAKKEAVLARGKELFTREWQAGDKRSHKGDGLGPLFNGASCAACHNLGGNGGGGPNSNNVTLVSAVLLAGPAKSKTDPTPRQPDRAKLADIHPSLRTANSFTLHRFATEKIFDVWKNSLLLGATDAEGTALAPSEPGTTPNLSQKITRQVGDWTIQLTAAGRNTPAIFGSGLIDRIPEKVLEQTAAAQALAAVPQALVTRLNEKGEGTIPVSGRVARLKDGRIGRFGWKAQVATLREFTLQACANEIGLEVPGFSQPALPWKPGYKAPGLDMTADECDSLIAFVASLDPPRQLRPESEQQKKDIVAGRKLFARVGCAACHQQKLGDVDGIYSDLLLHDMGTRLSDDGEYGSIAPGDGPDDQVEPLPTLTPTDPKPVAGVKGKTPKFGAGQQEWRTPPLWGVRDSAPYMHNGAAATIRAAIAMHGGEAKAAANAFAALKPEETVQVEQFLNSLAAPEGTR